MTDSRTQQHYTHTQTDREMRDDERGGREEREGEREKEREGEREGDGERGRWRARERERSRERERGRGMQKTERMQTGCQAHFVDSCQRFQHLLLPPSFCYEI